MQPNPDIYPSVYGATLTAENDRVEWSYPISHLNFLDKLPFEQPMDGSNSYIGFDPTINDCYVGAAKHTVMRINPEDKKQATIENTTYKKKINYRLLMMESDSYLSGLPITATYPAAWTNIISPWFSKFQESEQTLSFYNVMAEGTGTARLKNAALSYFSAYDSYVYAPITKINTDAIILRPQFRYLYLTPTYDSQGNITNISAYVTWYEYYQLKPQDKSAAGQYYDNELWEKGFKDTIDSETGRITSRAIITGARINTTYYGVNARNAFDRLSDSSWSDKNLRGNTFSVGLNILAEYYDEDRNAVIYEYPNGVFFSSGSDTIRKPLTPWYRFYNSALYVYTNVSPNAHGTSSSSTDNSGLICNNDTNDLVGSNTVVLPSNFVSLEDDGSRFEIHDNTNYYYFNDDGTVSAYSSYTSSGRQYYTYDNQASCFPLKDLVATIASFGFFFSDGATSVTSYVLDDPTTYDSHLYRGKFDENGVSDGTWWQGDDIPEDKLEDIDYVPEVPGGGGGGDTGDEESGSSIPIQRRLTMGAVSSFITSYGLTAAQVQEFGKKLWNSWVDNGGLVMAMVENFKFLIDSGIASNTGSIDISSVLDFIISLKVYPCDLTHLFAFSNNGMDGKIYIGRGTYGLEVSSSPIYKAINQLGYLDAGTYNVPRPFGDFRDYTNINITVYVPYCGTIELNPADVIGRQLSGTYVVDVMTGECTFFLEVIAVTDSGEHRYTVGTCDGQLGVTIPVSATNSGQIAARRFSDVAQFATTVGGFFNRNMQIGNDIAMQMATLGASGMASKNPEMASARESSIKMTGSQAYADNALGLLKDVTGQFGNSLTRAAIDAPNISGGSGIASFANPDCVWIQIRHGIYPTVNNYDHTVGKVSTKSAPLSSYSGFTVCHNVDVSSLSCTEEEKSAIKQLLETGVYL